MDLSLSLGDSSKGPFFLMPKTTHKKLRFDVGVTMAQEVDGSGGHREEDEVRRSLELFPLLPVSAHSCSIPTNQNGNSEGKIASTRGIDAKRAPACGDGDEEAAISSPNSTVSSFHMDFNMRGWNRRETGETMHSEGEAERTSWRAASDDDDENGLTRKKLRLTKEQSAFLEESFKERNTLNPRQKLTLAKQLNLSPRQVEVWFQNRRARTKLKQTEFDCEYLKKRCETLAEENRRLQREIQELRALKTSHPFCVRLPATTLTMCPSCEGIASSADNGSHSNTNSNTHRAPGSLSAFSLISRHKPRF